MKSQDYLIVYGYDMRRPQGCYKETEINFKDFIKFKPLLIEIKKKINDNCNWNNQVVLERNKNGEYITRNCLYEMYPNIDSKIIDEFTNYLPTFISKIISIKIFSGQKYNLI